MITLWVFVSIIIGCLFVQYHWSRRYLYLASFRINGPISLPIIGSTLPFVFCRTEDLLQKIFQLIEKHDNPIGFWLGSMLVVIFKKPQHLEKIMTSGKFSHKHEIYNIMKKFLGEGLITASGATYREHKKIIQPFFSLKFSEECIKIFEKHVEVCLKRMEQFVDGEEFDVGKIIHACTADIIGEVVLGYNFDSQKGKNMNYIEALEEVYKVTFARLVKPWLHPEVIFKVTPLGKQFKDVCRTTETLRQEVFSNNHRNTNSVTPVRDKISEFLKSSPNSISETDFWSHLLTLYMASQDTIAIITSAACLCFGMYPEYQNKAIQEIHKVLGKNSQNLNMENIGKLSYLDMCVKDVLRLFPAGPYILRKNLQDQEIDQWWVPKGCGLLIPIYNLHRDPKFWVNPEHFHPDHFLPEVEATRPACTYMPFSAGPRGCIGKIFASAGIKVLLVHLLQRYEIRANGKIPGLKFTTDISVRSQNGYEVTIKRRMS